MSTDIIILLAVGGIVGVFIILYIINSLEKARTKKAIQCTELQSRIMRLHQLFEGVPPSVLSQTVKLAGQKEILSHLLTLKKIDPKSTKFDSKVKESQVIIEEIQKQAQSPLKIDPINNPEELKDIRKKLTALFTFIQNSVKLGTLSPAAAKEEMDKLKQLFTESGAQYYLKVADNEYKQKKLRIALHHYKMAANEFKKANKPSAYGQQIQAINQKIELVEKEEQESKRSKAKNGQSNELADGFKQMQTEEDKSWQKKKF